MTNDEILEGIWQAKSESDLDDHMDVVRDAAITGRACYDFSFFLTILGATEEVRTNNFTRILH